MGWKQGRGEAPEQCPEGSRVLAYVAGSGRIVRGEYQGEASARIKARFTVESGAENLHKADGSPFLIDHWESAVIRPRSNAGKLITTARGRDLAEAEQGEFDEIPRAGEELALPAEIETLLSGLRVLAMVKHNDNGWAGFKADSCVRAPAQAADEGW